METDKLSGKSIVLWALAALLITLVLIGITKLVGPNQNSSEKGEYAADLPAVTDTDWISGAASSTVTLIEYSDFQCPACAYYYPTVERFVTDYSDRIRFVYRHFPLAQHQQAEPAAYAAEASGKQGKFWEMYRLLFEDRDEWAGKTTAEKTFESYAVKLGLDLLQYRRDVLSSEIKDRVRAVYRGGVTAGVNSTPTFYLNGYKIQNPGSYEGFKQVIDAALATTT